MALKRNLKMYIKETSTIIALVCVVVFAVKAFIRYAEGWMEVSGKRNCFGSCCNRNVYTADV